MVRQVATNKLLISPTTGVGNRMNRSRGKRQKGPIHHQHDLRAKRKRFNENNEGNTHASATPKAGLGSGYKIYAANISQKLSLSGKGNLTGKVIHSMQTYFGLAIRQNEGHLYLMKKAVGAMLWHCTDFEDDVFRHRLCLATKDSWCKWQRHHADSRISKKQYLSKSSINVPKWIHEELKPIFDDLSKDELLLKCLHGQPDPKCK